MVAERGPLEYESEFQAKLKKLKLKALRLMLAGASTTQAAAKVGRTTNTLYRWGLPAAVDRYRAMEAKAPADGRVRGGGDAAS